MDIVEMLYRSGDSISLEAAAENLHRNALAAIKEHIESDGVACDIRTMLTTIESALKGGG